MTSPPHAPHHRHRMSSVVRDATLPGADHHARRALRLAGWANIAIAAGHVVGLIWAWSMFRFVGIEAEMREIAAQGSALPYVFTLIPAAAICLFGLYALSAAGDVRRLPRLRAGLVVVAVIYVYRATLYDGFASVREGDAAQLAFSATALLIGLCYAYGAAVRGRSVPRSARRGASC